MDNLSQAKQWANLTDTLSTLPRGLKFGKIVIHFGCATVGLMQDPFGQIWGKVHFFPKALWGGVTNPCDISHFITVTPLFLSSKIINTNTLLLQVYFMNMHQALHDDSHPEVWLQCSMIMTTEPSS
jgi:hypothetical protein